MDVAQTRVQAVDQIFSERFGEIIDIKWAESISLPSLAQRDRGGLPHIWECGDISVIGSPRVKILTIPRDDLENSEHKKSPPLTWVHLESPNSEILKWVEQSFELGHAKLKDWLSERDPRDSFRYSNCLVTQCFSVISSSDNKSSLSTGRDVFVLGEDFFITISDKKSVLVDTVMTNVLEGKVPNQDFQSSNALAVNLAGSVLTKNELELEKIHENFSQYMNTSLSRLPNESDSLRISDISHNMWKASKIMSGFDDLLEVLGDRDNLFNEPSRRDSLRRYLRVVDSVEVNIKQTREMVEELQRAWLTQSERWQNQVVFKIGVISALSTPLVLVSSICGMNFQNPLPDWSMWGGLATAAVVGVGLVGALVLNKRRQE
jgi:Mg2+ and Co2+ transporter CorA